MPFDDGNSALLVVESIQRYLTTAPALMVSLLDRECAARTERFSEIWKAQFGGRTEATDLDLMPLNCFRYTYPQIDVNHERQLLLRDTLISQYCLSIDTRTLVRWLIAKDHLQGFFFRNIQPEYWMSAYLSPPGHLQTDGLKEICTNWSWRIALHLQLQNAPRTFWCWRNNLIAAQLCNAVSIEEKVLFFELVLGPILDQQVLSSSQFMQEICTHIRVLDMLEYIVTTFLQSLEVASIPWQSVELILHCLSSRPEVLYTLLECMKPWRADIVQQSLEMWIFDSETNVPIDNRFDQPVLKLLYSSDQQAKALIMEFWSLNAETVEIVKNMIDEWTKAQKTESLSLLYS